MKKCLNVRRGGQSYYVEYVKGQIFTDIIIYDYNPKRLFFKYKMLASYLKEAFEMFPELSSSIKKNLDPSAEDYLVKLAEYTVDHYLKELTEKEKEQELCSKQQAYFDSKTNICYGEIDH